MPNAPKGVTVKNRSVADAGILRRLISSIGMALIISVLFTQPASASGSYTTGSLGVDISYPNCSVTVPKVSFGIVGVTGGLVYSRNGCAAAEASHFGDL